MHVYLSRECPDHQLLGMHISHIQLYDTKTPNYKIFLKFSKISKDIPHYMSFVLSKCDVNTGRVMFGERGLAIFPRKMCKYISLYIA